MHPLFQKNGPWVTSQRKNEICFAILHLLDTFHPMTAPPEIFATNDKHVFQILIIEEGIWKSYWIWWKWSMAISISLLEINFIFVINNQIKSKLRRHRYVGARKGQRKSSFKTFIGRAWVMQLAGKWLEETYEHNCFGVAVSTESVVVYDKKEIDLKHWNAKREWSCPLNGITLNRCLLQHRDFNFIPH